MDDYEEVFTKNESLNIKNEFKRLEGKTYLDHAGASLYPESLLESSLKNLKNNLYLNPHTSKYTNDLIDQIRYLILDHFNTNVNEYSVIFTSGATASLKLVAESFEYNTKHENISNNGIFLHLQDNHTSVLGMRDIAKSQKADVLSITRNDLIELMKNYEIIKGNNKYFDVSECNRRALFVYPAMCNFNGYKYPLKWIDFINNGALNEYVKKKNGKNYSEWATFLDTASFVSTNSLDLSIYKPDFLCVSFYKIFGYPTGLGALIVKNDSIHMLNNRLYYGGGTVEIAMSLINYHVKRKMIYEQFEDGTLPFISIISLKHGFDVIKKLIPYKDFMDKISLHTFNLSRVLFCKLKSLHHSNGKPVVKLYSDSNYNDINYQGGIVNFNILRSNDQYIGYAEVVHMAELFNISIRSGCFCNPGACQRNLQLLNKDLLNHHKAGHKCGDNNDLINGIPTGSIRVSFGYMSTINDVTNFINMIIQCFVDGFPIIHEINLKSEQIISNKHEIILPKNNIINNSSIETLVDKNDLNNFTIKGILKELHIFPIKSCGSFDTNKWEIGEKGLKYDREWMIITSSGAALTQKQEPRLCLIRPYLDLKKNIMKLSYQDLDDISIPLNIEYNDQNVCHSKVCGNKINGYDCGNDVANWLSTALGLSDLRLLREYNDSQCNEKRLKIKNISLSNQGQYLMINLSSIKWLSKKITSGEFENSIENLTKRFRGNIIIETNTEFDEFKWKYMKIGLNEFNVDSPCTRCQMVCIDQDNGTKTTEPLSTISREFNGKLQFGIYLSNRNISNKKSQIQCGDIVSASLK